MIVYIIIALSETLPSIIIFIVIPELYVVTIGIYQDIVTASECVFIPKSRVYKYYVIILIDRNCESIIILEY